MPWRLAARLAVGLEIVLLCTVLAGEASAHYVGTALLHLTQLDAGRFSVTEATSTAMKRSDRGLDVSYPAQCQREAEWLVCSEPGLRGSIHVSGLTRHAELIVKVDWQSGESVTQVLTGQREHMDIAAPGAIGHGELILGYARQGVHHILEGADHLLFVLGLLLLVGFGRRLVWTITGFTLGHSLTLALTTLGVVRLSPLPVEAWIASSLVLVAIEALRGEASTSCPKSVPGFAASPAGEGRVETGKMGVLAFGLSSILGETRRGLRVSPISLARRYPWLLASVFGMVHGFGFGGALLDIGLPRAELAVALLSFNLGVEAGQVAFVLALVGLARAGGALSSRWRAMAASHGQVAARVRVGAAYVVGCAGAYLLVSRVGEMTARLP